MSESEKTVTPATAPNEDALENVTGGYEQGFYDFDEGDCFGFGTWIYKVLASYHHVTARTYIQADIYLNGKFYGRSGYPAYEFDTMKFVGNNII